MERPRIAQMLQGRERRREGGTGRLVFSRFIIRPKSDWQIDNVTKKRAQKQTCNIFKNDVTDLVLQITGERINHSLNGTGVTGYPL